MKLFSVIFAAVFTVLSSVSFARDQDCILQLEGLQAAFDTSIEGVTVIHPPILNKEEGHLSEIIETENGQRISFQTGGCAHYGFSLTYQDIGVFYGESPAELIAKAEALLKATPLNKSFSPNIESILQSFRAAEEKKIHFSEGNFVYACGDATCAIEVKDHILTIGYDFPL